MTGSEFGSYKDVLVSTESDRKDKPTPKFGENTHL